MYPSITDIENLAKIIHESNRFPVEQGHTLIKHKELGLPAPTFFEWNDLPEEAKQGKCDSAAFLLSKFYFVAKGENDPKPAQTIYERTSSETLRNCDY